MGSIVGIDSVIFAYFLQSHPEYGIRAEKILETVEKGERKGIFSVIGVIEVLTAPKQLGHPEVATEYREFFANFPNLKIKGITEGVVERASDLRAKYGLRTPDAIHIATAIDFGAQSFVTNDQRLKKITEIEVILL